MSLLLLLGVVGAAVQAWTMVWTMGGIPWEAETRWRYRLYVDAQPAVAVTGVTCRLITPGTYTECRAPLPTLADGTHTLRLSVTEGTREGDKSEPATVTIGVPPAPTGLRIR